MKYDYNISFVSNSTNAAKVISQIATEFGVYIDIQIVAMEEAVSVTANLLKEPNKVVIGCGSTGKMLTRHFSDRVVIFNTNFVAILNAVKNAKKYSDKIAIPFYEDIHEGLDIISEILNVRIIPVSFSSSDTLISCISKCIEEGISCFVGSNIAVKIARAQGCIAEEILYSEQEGRQAMKDAMRIAELYKRMETCKSFFYTLADCTGNIGVIAVNASKKVVFCNNEAVRVLNCDKTNLHSIEEKTKLFTISPAMEQRKQIEGVVKLSSKLSLRYNCIPIFSFNEICGLLILMQSFAKPLSNVKDFFKSKYSLEDIVGESKLIQELRTQASFFASTDATLFISGETGTGKEVLAHAVHNMSPRMQGPFVAINCAALSETLLESELFGYEEGAFTGAKRGGKEGIFTLAEGGTVFLDEIGDISPAMQMRLLRVLESKEFMKIGGDKNLHMNVRVISASWKNLSKEVKAGRFRADLYYRLSVLSLSLPPLRKRIEDIPSISAHLMERNGYSVELLSKKAFELMQQYQWPGNIRQLGMLLNRYCVLNQSKKQDDALFESLFFAIQEESIGIAESYAQESTPSTSVAKLQQALDGVSTMKSKMKICENFIANESLQQNQFNKVKTAKALDISTTTLWRMLKDKPSL